MDVVGEGLQGRDVYNLGCVGKSLLDAQAHQSVDAGQESGQGLSGAGRCGDQRMPALGNGRPARFLSLGGCLETALKPGLNNWVEAGKGHEGSLAYSEVALGRGIVTTKLLMHLGMGLVSYLHG